MAAIEMNGVEGEAGAEEPKRGSRAPALIGLALMALLGGGGFYAAYSGLATFPFGGRDGGAERNQVAGGGELPVFVDVGEQVIPLGPNARAKFLVIDTQIEANPEDVEAFEALRPRILDAFNTFLRALDEADIEAPSASLRLRAQLLRRVRAVSAPAEPHDLLITSFVLK